MTPFSLPFASLVTLAVLTLAAASSHAARPETPPPPDPATALDGLREGHPRLIFTPDRVAQLRADVAADRFPEGWVEAVRREADAVVEQPVSVYDLPDGKRLLSVSRRVVERAQLLGLMYLLSDEPRYRDRLWAELEAAAAFADWNPSHFLDTAEMTYGFAIGYDWLYDAWTPRQRQTLREAIVRLGLNEGLACYEGRGGHGWWVNATHNWNQVCNGGLTLGALAVAEDEPELAARIVSEAVRRIPAAMHDYAPDGGWPEGPSYWSYATRYNVAMIAGLETALGRDFGLAEQPGFDRAAMFPVYITGPTGFTFNYADTGEPDTLDGPEIFWLAQRFDLPAAARFELHQAATKPEPLHLIWYPRDLLEGGENPPLPLDHLFRETEVATLRSGWDPDALFVGLKAGSNAANHSNLDLGSFVFEAGGVRWAIDLGKDNYNLPAYFDTRKNGTRWTYYRMRAEAHNTLVFAPREGSKPGPDQDFKARVHITGFESFDDRGTATVDLTPAYRGEADGAVERVVRTVTLDRGGAEAAGVTVHDEIALANPVRVLWSMHTRATIEVSEDGRSATLSHDGRSLRAALTAPADAVFQVMDAHPLPGSPNPAGQKSNEGIQKLAVQLVPFPSGEITVRLELDPLD